MQPQNDKVFRLFLWKNWQIYFTEAITQQIAIKYCMYIRMALVSRCLLMMDIAIQLEQFVWKLYQDLASMLSSTVGAYEHFFLFPHRSKLSKQEIESRRKIIILLHKNNSLVLMEILNSNTTIWIIHQRLLWNPCKTENLKQEPSVWWFLQCLLNQYCGSNYCISWHEIKGK